MNPPDPFGERQRQIDKLDGVMDDEDLACALNISRATLRGLGIPHVDLGRSSHLYFIDEVITWLRDRERSL